MSQLMRVREVSKLAAVSPAFVYGEIRKGDLPGYRLKGSEDLLVRRDAHEPALRQRTSGPPKLAVVVEPLQNSRVVKMIRPGQRDQDVDIQEADHHSSRARLTISGVMGGASGATSKTGKGLFVGSRGARPSRARFVITRSTVLPVVSARLRAASRTSSSI